MVNRVGPPEVIDPSPLLAPICEKYKLPALGGAILTKGEVTSLGVIGLRKRGGTEPVTAQDLWHIGSCTKAMTATLVGIMVDEGTLRWDLTLAEAFPDLAPTMHESYKTVTIEQLLTHRAGVPGELNADGLWASLWKHTGTPVEQRRALTEGVLKKAPVHAPGNKYLYSNAGFAIAGHIAETTTGVAWEELMRQKLFKPLGMASAGFGAPGSTASVDQPRGHRGAGAAVEPGKQADNPAAIGPGGTVHCSLEDWSKFIALHLDCAAGRVRLLKPATVAKLHTAAPGPGQKYALGWGLFERPWGDGTVLTHSGSNTMWFAVTWIAPKKDFAVLVVCNQGDGDAPKACDDAAAALIQAHQTKR